MAFLTEQPIDLRALEARVQRPDRGAVVSFVGQVRDHHAGHQVTSLNYSAYQPMAEKICTDIVASAETKWPVSIAMVHRIGELVIGDLAVAIVVSAAHRDEAFAACRWVIEEVKTRLPIWKRELFVDGTEVWVDPTVAAAAPHARP